MDRWPSVFLAGTGAATYAAVGVALAALHASRCGVADDPAARLVVLPGNSEKFRSIVRQVQTALDTCGYCTGATDGLVRPQTNAAISRAQTDYGAERSSG